MKIYQERYTRIHRTEPKALKGIRKYRQPRLVRGIGSVYHYYHKASLPIWAKVERLMVVISDRLHKQESNYFYTPITNRQDLRCEGVRQWRRTIISEDEKEISKEEALNNLTER